MKINIELPSKEASSYNVYINEEFKINLKSKVAIVTNETIANLHLNALLSMLNLKEYTLILIPDGEIYKNYETIELILEKLFLDKFDRSSTILAFGGGVVGDMSGFAASIYQRGIEFIQIPTTLLAQVDSSVGGKTGINNKFGKNLIGSFHQPSAVYCQTKFLKTLPKREFNAGLAEVIKMAITFDERFFLWLEGNLLDNEQDLEECIKRSIKLKADIVSKDEKEQGIRAALNYGHTFAHVIENETNYNTFLHGEAVSMGIIMANKLALSLGILDISKYERIKKLLEKFNLPTSYKIKSTTSFYEAFFLDKKSKNSKITFVLPRGIGKFAFYDDIPKESILYTLKEFSDE